VAFVTRNNQLFLLIDGPALIVGIATGWLRLGPWDPLIKTALFIAGPVAAVLAYGIIKPDPGCSYDCIDSSFGAACSCSRSVRGGSGSSSAS
jgi:hypothetical protein